MSLSLSCKNCINKSMNYFQCRILIMMKTWVVREVATSKMAKEGLVSCLLIKKTHTSLFLKNICNNSCALTMVDFVFLTFWQEFKIIKSFSSFTHGPVVSHSPREAIFPEKLFSLRSWPPPPFEKKPHPSPSHYTILVSSDFKMVTSYCLFYRLCACLWRRREGAST